MNFQEQLNAIIAKGFATASERAELKKLAGDDAANLELLKRIEALPTEKTDDADVQKQLTDLLAKSVDEIRKGMEADFAKKFEAFKAEHKETATKRAGLYNPEVAVERKLRNDNLRKFVNALVANDVAVLKELSTGTDNKGGYLIDTQLEAEVQALVTNYGWARREMKVTPLSRNLKLNNLVTDVEVFWTDEGAEKTTSDVEFGQMELELKKLATIIPMTDELLEDAEFDLLAFLQERVAEAMAKKEDEAFSKGDGSGAFGGFTGVLNNTSVNEVVISGGVGAITPDDLIAMQDATPESGFANAKYHMHRSILSVIRKMKDDTGAYLYVPVTQNAPSTILGYPLVLVEAFPKINDSGVGGFVIFGDLRRACWVGVKGGITFATSNEATVRNAAGNADLNLFRRDMTALRAVERVGFAVVNPKVITVLRTGEVSA